MIRSSLAIASLSLFTFACGSSSTPSGFTDPNKANQNGNTGGDANNGSTNNGGGSLGQGGGMGTGTGTGTGTDQPAEVWGHSPDTLYRVDATTKAVTVQAKFDGCDPVIDLALDSTSNMFVTTQTALYRVDKTTAKCTHIATANYPNSLSFVPAGTLDPNVEALVGYVGDSYVRIDTSSGAISTVGGLGAGDNIVSSGDIVSVKDGPSYLTVTGGAMCSLMDCLVEVDPKSGKMLKNHGSIAHGSVYGLAFWAGEVYGFDDGGELFSVTIDPNTGAITTTPIPVPNAPNGLQFWGAGSTTSAPVTGPK